jgi:hypothetical protein
LIEELAEPRRRSGDLLAQGGEQRAVARRELGRCRSQPWTMPSRYARRTSSAVRAQARKTASRFADRSASFRGSRWADREERRRAVDDGDPVPESASWSSRRTSSTEGCLSH